VDVGRRRQRRSRRSTLLLGVGAGAVVAAFTAIALLVTGVFSTGGAAPSNPAGHVVGAPVQLPHDPDHLAVGGGRVWALAATGNQLVRFDIDSGTLDTFSAAVDLGGGSFADVEVGANAVWIAHAVEDVGGVDHVNPQTGEAVQHVPFPLATALAVGEHEVWAVAPGRSKGPGSLARIATPSDRITTKLATGHDPSSVALAAGSVWVANRADDSVWRFDPKTGAVTARIRVGDQPGVIAASGGNVWVANLGDNTLMRIDSATSRVEGAAIALGKEIHDLTASAEAVWVSAADGTVTRLDPRTGRQVGVPFTPAPAPLSLAVANGVLWVGSSGDRTLTQIEEGST
jgi:streptogramin lyase